MEINPLIYLMKTFLKNISEYLTYNSEYVNAILKQI